jgi:hypothetical protein
VADIPFNFFGLEHVWLRTASSEAGLGLPGGAVPAEAQYRTRDASPYFTKTEVVDHAGRGNRAGVVCDEIPEDFIDEECVNRELDIGKPQGRWSPLNQCQTFVDEVLETCGRVPVDW